MSNLPLPGTAIILTRGSETWRTELVSAGEEGIFLDAGDLLPESLLAVEAGERLNCRCHETSALVTFDCLLIGFRKDSSGKDRLWLSPPPKVTRTQRRQHIRVASEIPIQLNLMLRNDQLSRSLRREVGYRCWIQAIAASISIGGFKVRLKLPLYHRVGIHGNALARFEINERSFRDKRLAFIRHDWLSKEPVVVYRFVDLDREEKEWIENIDNSMLQ